RAAVTYCSRRVPVSQASGRALVCTIRKPSSEATRKARSRSGSRLLTITPIGSIVVRFRRAVDGCSANPPVTQGDYPRGPRAGPSQSRPGRQGRRQQPTELVFFWRTRLG